MNAIPSSSDDTMLSTIQNAALSCTYICASNTKAQVCALAQGPSVTVNISQVYKESPGTQSVLLRGVQSLSFSYFYYDETNQVYLWADEWRGKPDTLPLAVRFNVEITRDGRRKNYSRVFPVPVGGHL